MFTKAFLSSTLEWVLVAAAGAVASALVDGGIHSWADLGKAAGTAGLLALVKCLAASRTGAGTPAIVEPGK